MGVLIEDLLTLHERTAVPRAWPRPDGTIIVELRDTHDRLRAGTLTTSGLDLLPHGEDPRLPGLAELVRTGGDLVVHRAGRRAVVRHEGRYVKLVRPSKVRGVARAARDAVDRAAGTGIDVPVVLSTGTDRVEFAALPGTVPALSDEAAWTEFGERWPAVARTDASALQPHDAAREAETLETWLGHARRHAALPTDLQRPLEEAARSASAALRSGRADPAVFLHRDLHPRQLLWDRHRGRLGVLDVDTAARGEAALDLGNLLAHLDHSRALTPGDDDTAARAGIALAVDRLAASEGRLRIYTRAATLRLVCVHAFRPPNRDATLQWARDLLGTG